ncbi:MAG: amidohydrolase family protein, partial [Dehalococcoidia bacterium]
MIRFVNAFLLDGRGGYHERSGLTIDDDRITAVGPHHAAGPSRNDDTVIDLQGRTLMPGMIDTHCHPGGGDYDPAHEHEPPGMQALRTVEAVQRTLRAGFTTIRSAGTKHAVDVDVRTAINQGLVWGPRLIASGPGITCTAGHGHFWATEVDGPDAIRAEVRRQILRIGVDSIKILAVSGGIATANQEIDTEHYTVEEIAAAVDQSRKLGKLNQTHAISLKGIKNAVTAGVNSIDNGIFLDEEACTRMRDQGIFLVPSFGPFVYYEFKRIAEPWRWERSLGVHEHHVRSFRMAIDLGVPIALGSDNGAPSRFKAGDNAEEYQFMVEAGMPPELAIIAGALDAARLLHLDGLIGSLEPGKLADLIVVDGNPLEDITTLHNRLVFVMCGGRIYRDDLGLAGTAGPALHGVP